MTKNNNSPINEQLEAIISLGKQLMESENYEDAIALYNQALEFYPNNATIYCDRAWVYSELEEDEKAILDYTKAIELDPNYTDAYKNLAEFYKNLGEYEKSIATYDKIIELKPNEANGYYLRGIVYSNLREYETAIVNYNKSIELDASFSFTYYTRGIAYNGLGKYKKAIADFTKSIELNPSFGFTYHSRGNAYKNLEEYGTAIVDYNKAIELYPTVGSFYYDRGIAYSELDEYEESIANLTQAIKLGTNNSDAYYLLGSAYYNLGEEEESIVNLTQAIKLDPNNSNAYYLRASVYYNLGEEEEAIADYNKALELNPNLDSDFQDNDSEEYEEEDEDNNSDFIENEEQCLEQESEVIETFKLSNSELFTEVTIESDDSNKFSLNENTVYIVPSYRTIFTTKNNEFICVNLNRQQLFALKQMIVLSETHKKSSSFVDYYYQERLADKAQLLTNEDECFKNSDFIYKEEQCYELFSHFFPENINPIEATNLIKKFTLLCEQEKVIPFFSKFVEGNSAIMDACVFDQYEDEEILIVDAMEECYQDYKPAFYFGSDFEIFIKNSNSFSFPSFVILNEFGLIIKNPLTLPEFYAPVPVPKTAFDKIYWNGCNHDLLGIAEKNDKLVIVIQPHESFYMGITNMKDDDTFQEREQKKAILIFIYLILKKYWKIYKVYKNSPSITYFEDTGIGVLPLEKDKQFVESLTWLKRFPSKNNIFKKISNIFKKDNPTPFETMFTLLEQCDIKTEDFDTLLTHIETIPWIF